jgi:hypothetical protein
LDFPVAVCSRARFERQWLKEQTREAATCVQKLGPAPAHLGVAGGSKGA